MTSKISSVKLTKESMKRGGAFGVLLTLFFFCYYPLAGMLSLGNMSGYKPISENTEFIFRECHAQIINAFTLTVVLFAALLMGILQFSWLHSREKLDFYHSLPIRRERLFCAHYAGGVLLFFLPLAGNMLLYFLICAVKGVAGILAADIGKALVAYTCCYLLAYSFSVLAMMLTGKLFAAICGLLFFMGYVPALRLLWELLMSSFFVTYVPMEHMESSPFIRCTPLYAFIRIGISTGMYGKEAPSYLADFLLALVLLSFLIAGLCIYLYRRRPSEKAGSPMVFHGLARVAKFILVVPATMVVILFFFGMGDYNIFWGLFGWLFGLLLFSGLIEFIYCMDIREIFRDRRQIVLTGIVTLFVFLFFYLDLSGYDKWLPKSEEVESVLVEVPDHTEFQTPQKAEYQLNYDGLETDLYEQAGEMSSTFDTQQVDAILELVKKSVSFTGQYRTAEEAYDLIYTADGAGTVRLNVVWTMKDQTQEKRMYMYDGSEFKKAFAPIFETQEYKNAAYPILTTDPEDILGLSIALDYVYAMPWQIEAPGEAFSGKQKIDAQTETEAGVGEETDDLQIAPEVVLGSQAISPKAPLTLQQVREVAQAYREDAKALTLDQVQGSYYTITILYREKESGKTYAVRYPLYEKGCGRTWKALQKYYDLEKQQER